MFLGQEGADSVQASLGEGSTILKPLLGDVETARRDGARAHPPELLGANQVTLLQNLEVLYHRRKGDRERRSQLTDGDRRRTMASTQTPTSKVFFAVSMSLDGYIAPAGMDRRTCQTGPSSCVTKIRGQGKARRT